MTIPDLYIVEMTFSDALCYMRFVDLTRHFKPDSSNRYIVQRVSSRLFGLIETLQSYLPLGHFCPSGNILFHFCPYLLSLRLRLSGKIPIVLFRARSTSF